MTGPNATQSGVASVADKAALERALDDALARDGPTLVDADVPTDEPSAAAAVDFGTDLQL